MNTVENENESEYYVGVDTHTTQVQAAKPEESAVLNTLSIVVSVSGLGRQLLRGSTPLICGVEEANPPAVAVLSGTVREIRLLGAEDSKR